MLFNIGDAVWAKMKGFPPWPGKIDHPTEDMKSQPKRTISYHCIYFFGSKNYAWIEESKLKPYFKYRAALAKSSKTAAFKEAIIQMEEYVANPTAFIEEQKSNKSTNDVKFNKLLQAGKPTTLTTKPLPKEKKIKSSPRRSNKRPFSVADNDIITMMNTAVTNERSVSPASKIRKRARETISRSEARSSKQDVNTGSGLTEHYSGPSEPSVPSRYDRVINRKDIFVTELLDLTHIDRPDTPPIDVRSVSLTLKAKNIKPSKLTFGFLGLGNMGSGIVKNLLDSGHSVFVWNRTSSKTIELEKIGAKVNITPGDVIQSADITFSCVSDPQAAKEMVFGNCGVLHASTISERKGYVEMTSIDSETSQDIADAIVAKGGRYLEAQIQGTKTQAEEGSLVILAAGDRELFDECQSCFEAISKHSFFLGQIGNASKLNLVLQMMNGITIAALAEGMALADRSGIQYKDVLEVMQLTSLASPILVDKAKAIIEGEFARQMPLSLMQKDLKLALDMSDAYVLPLPLSSSANEVYKHTKRLGYGDHDVSAVYIRARF